MRAANSAGRIVGVLILAQMVGGVLVNVFLTAPLLGSPEFLLNTAPHAPQIALSGSTILILYTVRLRFALIRRMAGRVRPGGRHAAAHRERLS